jgi:hypothetical protein
MPMIFIHGVNTRRGSESGRNVAARNKLLQHYVLDPLATKGDRFKQIKIVNPYWGDSGVKFRWDQASLPDVRTLEHLGPETMETTESDLELTAVVRDLAGTRKQAPSRLESLGTGSGMFKQAATKDLRRFIQAILSPIIFSEMDLSVEVDDSPEMEGAREALLIVAGQELAADVAIRNAVVNASSDEEVMNLLKEGIQAHFQQLLMSNNLVPSQDATPIVDERLESLGSVPDLLDDIQDRVGVIIDRALDAPHRAATILALDPYREKWHRKFSRFLGDVFVYLNEPGPIVSTVLQAIVTAPKYHDDEPVIIITHSMGGNILYDILTYYAPKLQVDVWVSVGGQVGQFEEMKLFKASRKEIGKPEKLIGLKPRVRYWLNVYDPADIFAFKAKPIFADVDEEVEFLTGSGDLKSHGAYFKREDFYQLLRDCMEGHFHDTNLR